MNTFLIFYFLKHVECDYDIQYGERTFTAKIAVNNWASSRTTCQSDSGDLAIINDNHLSGLFNHYVSWAPSIWIGLNDSHELNSPASFVWVNNTFANYYVDWGFFDTDPTCNCVLMYQTGGNYKWKNIPCGAFSYALCEKGRSRFISTIYYFLFQ